jgi:hypothetical protein
MRPKRWWSVIFTMGLFMALSPLSAQAGPNRTFAPQVNRQAFHAPQPRACAPQPNHQAFTRPQPRGFANGWNSQPRQQPPRGNAYGWHGQNRPPGNAYGWNNHQRQGDQHHNAYGRNDHRGQWDQHRNVYGGNDHQRQWGQQRNAQGGNDHQRQGQQPRPAFAQGDRLENRQFQPPNGGQQHNPGSPYNRASYPAQAQVPNIAPRSSGYSHNTTIPAGQTGVQPISQSDGPGNGPRHQGNSSVGGI